MSPISIKYPESTDLNNDIVKVFYEAYAQKLYRYTCKNYSINEDDAWTIVYKTIYKLAEVNSKYSFENKQKQAGFVFKTHINFLRNYFRDNKSFEVNNLEVELNDNLPFVKEEGLIKENTHLKILQGELDKLEEWQRILLLMRGQDIPYSEITAFVSKPEKQLKVYYARLKKQLLDNINAELTRLNSTANEKK
jgi:DNA-directed RNA polymerase specialized sigma24 family protein